MAKSDLCIDILGTSITISTDEEQEYLIMLLNKYRRTIENVQRISGLKDPLKVAVLTGFLLSDDLEKAEKAISAEKAEPAREKTEHSSIDGSGEAEKLTLGMIARLDEALNVPLAAPFAVTKFPAETPTEGPLEPASDAPVLPDHGIAAAYADTAYSDEKKSVFIFKLQNTIKNYAWGSAEWIPSLLGQKNLSRIPWAELWMGVNPAGPSRVVSGTSKNEPAKTGASPLLSELIGGDAEFFLGKETAGASGTLPFLFKVVAAAKPLSIQAHPNRGQARDGFERENQEGIPLDAPHRNYRDANHKPEIICALTNFAALCGFREKGQIGVLLDILAHNSDGALKAGFESLGSALGQGDEPYRTFLAALFNLDGEVRQALGPFMRTRLARFQRDYPEYRDEWELCSYLAGFYPGDPGILSPLYLNIMELAPGEAMYLPAGVFHAYIHGMGMELMADSDNVLRGGLTSKHVDQQELFRILNFSEYKPEILKVSEPVSAWFTYPAPSEEFTLSVMRGSGNAVSYPEQSPAIVMVTEGNALVTETGKGDEVFLNTGESVFIPAGKRGKLSFNGTFTAYAASAGRGVSV